MNKSFFLILMLTLASSCNKCKDENCIDSSNPSCENYDPCLFKVNADFQVPAWDTSWIGGLEPSFFNDSSFSMGDTILQSVITFESLHKASSYKWTIGSHPENFFTPKASLSFYNYTGELFVTLVASKNKIADCQNDDGIDTVTKKLMIIPVLRDSQDFIVGVNIAGKYQGTILDDDDIVPFNIEIYKYLDGDVAEYRIKNLVRCSENSPTLDIDVSVSSLTTFFSDNGRYYTGCNRKSYLKGQIIQTGLQDSIRVVTLDVIDPGDGITPYKDWKREERTFVGVRIE